jgi:oligopeptidase B
MAGIEYHLEHRDGEFLILTNDGAKNFRLMRTAAGKTARPNWEEWIAHRPEVKLEDFEVFGGFVVVYEREQGLTKIRVIEPAAAGDHYVEFPEPVYTAWGAGNPEYASAALRFSYTSLVAPRAVYEYDMRTRAKRLLKETEVLGGYDRTRYRTERLYAQSADGARVPMSLVCRRDLDPAKTHPLLLYGYGAYGLSVDPQFSSVRLSLLDRGFIYVIAHVRGGGDLGRPWYEDGKLLKKNNTFADFTACAEHLIRAGLTSPPQLAIWGGSAGGLLIGAVLNRRPELFGAAVAEVPFVDVVNTMLDPSLPLTVIEYEEWGNPGQKEYFEAMLGYSPYENVRRAAYPALLIDTGLNDPRVQYWEPVKWAQKLRELKTGDRKVLVRINMGTGHGGASGRYDSLKEVAFQYAFLLGQTGMRGAVREAGA